MVIQQRRVQLLELVRLARQQLGYLLLQQLHGVHGAGADLNLLARTGREQDPALQALLERLVVRENAERLQHLRDPVVGKGGQKVDVVELAVALALEAGPQVGHEYLGTLVDADPVALELELVAVGGKVVDDEVDELSGALLGLRDEVGGGAAELGQEDTACVVEGG